MCCIFPYRTKNEQRLCFFIRSSHTWHNCHTLQLKLQQECDMGWYRYTSDVENQWTACYKIWKLCSFGATWKNTALVQWIRCEPLGEHLIHWMIAPFLHIARKVKNVCIFSHDQVTLDITAIHCISNYNKSAVQADTDIRLMVKQWCYWCIIIVQWVWDFRRTPYSFHVLHCPTSHEKWTTFVLSHTIKTHIT